MAASLALGKFLVGGSIFFLVTNWIFEADRVEPAWRYYKKTGTRFSFRGFFRGMSEENFKPKWRLFKARPAIAVLMGVVVLHLIGVIWTNNPHAAWNDIKIKLPLLLIPLVIGTTPPLSKKIFELLLLTFVIAVFTSTLSTILIANGIIPTKKIVNNLRDASVFVPLIRLSLMSALSVFFLARWIVREKRILLRIGSAIMICWFLWFLQYMQSLTGLVILFFGGFILVVVMLFLYRKKLAAIALSILFVTGSIVGGVMLKNYYTKNFTVIPADMQHLNDLTRRGHPYHHRFDYPMIENGNQVLVYCCWEELDSAWNSRSKIPFMTGKNADGDPIAYSVLRYLSSKGERKDAEAVNALTAEEIHAIEHGATNALDTERTPLERRVYQVSWELYHYLHNGNPSGNSVTMRMEIARTALSCIKAKPWIGVGTGGQQKAYEAAYKINHSKLDEAYQWMHAHNQFISIAVCLGIPALLYFIFSLWYAPYRMKRWRSYLYLAFFIVICMSFFDDDTLETSQGVNFFAFFNALFLYAMPRESALADKKAESAEAERN
jgi:hypothetical protein